MPSFREGSRFAVVSDLQRTSWMEFWRESNDPERSVIVRSIAAERPAFIAMGGDLVFDGASPQQWAEFDALCTPLREALIPVYSALGNHEYWGGQTGEGHFFARFPHLEWKHWYSIPYGPLRIVVLDSNVDDLLPSAWKKQAAWFERTLADFDRDPEVRGVLVLVHHPPFTNSTVTGDELHVQQAFLPAFKKATKTLAVLSGHVHSYERFLLGGKAFVVIGGGGGPRAKLQDAAQRRHTDDLVQAPTLRDFHFLLFTMKATGLEATVMGVAKGGKSATARDHFELPWPR